MGNLKDELPEITQKVLHEEDKITRGLVKTLLKQVIVNQNKLDPYPTIKKILDDEIENSITAGIIDSKNF